MSTPSTLVADRYRLVKMLGAGGMGVVWQAWDERLQRPVALKMLRTQPELTDRERQTATDRAMREARITAGLHHPHAVTVFDVVQHEGQPCIVMQLIESTPLSDLLREHGTMSPGETARIGAQIGSALAAAHRMRIVHRDVKPGNILITEEGSAMISDFGISHALGDATITATGMIHGTPAYLAPEVARGQPSSFASDVFSLGSTLYAMLEGAPPFGSDKNAIALLHRVARGGYPPPKHAGPLAPLLWEMLATQPKRRPTMASIAESLAALQSGARGAPAAVSAEVGPLEWPGYSSPTEPLEDAPSEQIAPAPPTPGTIPALGAAAAQVTPPPPTPRTIPVADVVESPPSPAAAAAVPVVASTPVARSEVAPTAETERVDRPTRFEAATAETEPMARAVAPRETTAATPPTVPPPKSAPSSPGSDRRGRRGVALAGALLLLGALVVGAALLFSTLRPNVEGADVPTASEAPTNSPSATEDTEEEDAEAAPAPNVTPSEAQREPELPPPTAEERVAGTLSGYYAMLPEDLDSAWPLMTADYQENHAGGRGGYEAFWGGIADVQIADVTVPAPDQAQATLTYYYRDGSVVEEVTAYRLVEEGGVLKIAETDVLSSSRL